MESLPSVVIKVKYGDVLRRFNARVVDKCLNLGFVGLREKIVSLFSFSPDTELILTYVDEDNDLVNLVDDNDIYDVVKQGLNPLRITVEVNSGKNGEYASTTESSTPLRSPRVHQPAQNLPNGVSEILRTLPEPVQETVLKLATDLISRASSAGPVVSEIIDNVSKVGISHLAKLLEPQPGVRSSMQGGASPNTSATGTRWGIPEVDPAPASTAAPVVRSDLSSNKNDGLEKLKPGVAMENEVKISSVTRRQSDGSPFDFSAVAAALEFQNMNVSPTGNDFLLNPAPARLKSGGISHYSKKGKFKKAIEMSPLPPVVNNFGRNVYSGDSTSNPSSVTKKVSAAEGACNPNEHKHTVNECPFSGIAVENVSTIPPYSASKAISSERSTNQNDGSQYIVHRGIICDGCDVNPITGPRFKSKVKVDYDLCSACFEKMGNCMDYIRMDFPVVCPRHVPFVGDPSDAQARVRGQNLPQVDDDRKFNPVAIKLDSCFVEDVNIPDGTIMAPVISFTKIWRMRNSGTVGWLQGTQLVWIGGDKMSDVLSVKLKIPPGGVWMNQELDVVALCLTPELPGEYVSYWRMATPTGEKFGQHIWVHIQVDASINKTRNETIRNLNLNLPPGANNCFDGPEIINVEPEPWVRGSHPESDNSKKIVELVPPETEQDLKFPINNNLLVGNVGPNTDLYSASSLVSYPVVDISNFSVVPFPSVPPMPMTPHSKASVANRLPESNQMNKKVDIEMEVRLLRKLEAMGFNQADLNRAVLRMNRYNLEQAVEGLCKCGEGGEWDLHLVELEEMGFCDREKNKVLLNKNNGSIKLVVLDLIAGNMD